MTEPTPADRAAEIIRRELPGFASRIDARSDELHVRAMLPFGTSIALDATYAVPGSEVAAEELAERLVKKTRENGIALLGLEKMIREELQRARHEARREGFADGKVAGHAEGRSEMLAEIVKSFADAGLYMPRIADAEAPNVETVGHPADAVAECGRCGRSTWDAAAIGRLDEMTQPNGKPCGGVFLAVHRG